MEFPNCPSAVFFEFLDGWQETSVKQVRGFGIDNPGRFAPALRHQAG
jgi:hypothetical protein